MLSNAVQSAAVSTFPDDLMVLYVKHGRRDEDVLHLFQELRTEAEDGDFLGRQERVEAGVQGVGVGQAWKRHGRHSGHRGRTEGMFSWNVVYITNKYSGFPMNNNLAVIC